MEHVILTIVYIVGESSDDDVTLVYQDGNLKCYDEGLPQTILDVLCPDITKHTRKQRMKKRQCVDYPRKLEDVLQWEVDS